MKVPNNYIRIAGLGVQWDSKYAWVYKEKLDEVGFFSKVIESKKSNKKYVAYSHRSFTKKEAEEFLKKLLDGVDNDICEKKSS